MTYHSILRTAERANLNQQSAIRMIERAKECGKKSEQFPADERNYMKRLETEGKTVLYHAGYCFVLGDDFICITMFPVPKWFGKKTKHCGKTYVRRPKKYFKMLGEDYASKREIQQYCV